MSLPRKFALVGLLPSAACLLYVGCAKTPRPDPMATQTTRPSDVPNRLLELQRHVADLDTATRQLPGGTETTNRKIAETCFLELTKILPLIEGDYQSGEYVSGLRVLTTTREQLGSGSTEMATEPTIAQGLRAAERLLRNLDTFIFDKDAGILAQVDALHQKIIESDSAHGATQRAIAAQSFRAVSEICQQMTTSMVERAGTDGRPTTGPTTGPTTLPSPTPSPTAAPDAPSPTPTPAPAPDAKPAEDSKPAIPKTETPAPQ